ncbi:MAG UNVERIFIED_CONTAM: hypothetical protein LVT10_12045 [Anaerolineae bacterium]|jgi:hypothetical protein
MAELVHAVLAADGITAGMVEQQQLRSRLVMMFLMWMRIRSSSSLYNSQLDEGYFQMLTVAIQQLVTQGNVEITKHDAGATDHRTALNSGAQNSR